MYCTDMFLHLSKGLVAYRLVHSTYQRTMRRTDLFLQLIKGMGSVQTCSFPLLREGGGIINCRITAL